MWGVARCYYNGDGVEEDEEKAIKWYEKAAKENNDLRIIDVLCAYYRSNDYYKFKYWCEKYVTLSDDVNEWHNYAECLYYGGKYSFWIEDFSIRKDKSESFDWFMKAAEQGHADAMFDVGILYYYGCNSDMYWDSYIGEWYDSGTLKKDYDKAFEWFQKAVDHDITAAKYYMGLCYKRGHGVEPDDDDAFYWFEQAANEGYANAQYWLGECYYYGNGTEQSYAEAVDWYRQAAEQKQHDAEYSLGYCYVKGQGVDVNLKKARYWLNKAAKFDNSARDLLREIR